MRANGGDGNLWGERVHNHRQIRRSLRLVALLGVPFIEWPAGLENIDTEYFIAKCNDAEWKVLRYKLHGKLSTQMGIVCLPKQNAV